MLTIHTLIYSQLKFIANKDMRRRKIATRGEKHSRSIVLETFKLQETAQFTWMICSLCPIPFKLQKPAQFMSVICFLRLNLHSLCEWSVFSASYLMFILPLTAISCRSKMSHRKERADSLLFLRAGHSEPNGRPTASAGGPEMWRFCQATGLFVNSGPIR